MNLTDALTEEFDKTEIDFENYSLAEELDRVEGMPISGYKVLIRPYQAPKTKKTNGIWISDNAFDSKKDEDKYGSISGLVLRFGPGAYDPERFKKTPPYCQVGQWVIFIPGSATRITYDGVDYLFIDDDLILTPVDDPRKVSKLKANRQYH